MSLTPLVEGTFAGPGGWDEGLRMLGVTSHVVGYEWDRAACRTATAAGAAVEAAARAWHAPIYVGLDGA